MSNVSDELSDAEVARRIARLTRRSFITGGVAAAVGAAGFGWTNWLAPREEETPWPLRRILEANERIAGRLYKPTRLAPEYPSHLANEPRANGHVGLAEAIDVARWSMTIEQAERQTQTLSLAQIRHLPQVTSTTEIKCVEGWSQVVSWTGVRLSDFVVAHGLARKNEKPLRYVQLLTLDEQYYVGLDLPSALHPQTLLCYEMNGRPLTASHGAPLRLVIPVKYGIKNLKRIGKIRFTNDRPRDYWAERGYDWYAGL